ncbi:MAG: cytochrome b/b6 domain-containing protein [Gammaproteobacteria bacterium]|nr:cytochrome b/b6 domain-containing protein [Gammaproteobacteria bacterium]
MSTVRIWDLPTRLFHWLFAAACVTAWVSGDEPRYTDLHLFAGYLALGLVLFRLVWGVMGGRYARFSQFVRGPAVVLSHLRHLFERERRHEPGHNPAGAVAIVLMLGLVFALGVTGLVVLGGEEGFGPLAGFFTVAQGVTLHGWHEWLGWALLIVVLLHLVGVALESVLQRRNLPRSMVSGTAPANKDEAEPHNAAATAVVLLLVVSGFAVSWFYPYLQEDKEDPYHPFVAGDLKRNPVWQEACSECHMAYHPSLLPDRSWQRMLDEQADHFGEDLFLLPETVAALRRFAAESAAGQVERELSWRTLHSLSAGQTPLRITDTPYWKSVHREIDAGTWKRPAVNGEFNCAACHQDAEQGGFMNGAMRIPE